MFDNGILGLQGVDVTQPSVMEKPTTTLVKALSKYLPQLTLLGTVCQRWTHCVYNKRCFTTRFIKKQ